MFPCALMQLSFKQNLKRYCELFWLHLSNVQNKINYIVYNIPLFPPCCSRASSLNSFHNYCPVEDSKGHSVLCDCYLSIYVGLVTYLELCPCINTCLVPPGCISYFFHGACHWSLNDTSAPSRLLLGRNNPSLLDLLKGNFC